MTTDLWTAESLLACLEHLEPVELLGLTLLEQCQPYSGWFPVNVDPEQIAKATVQFIEYADRSEQAAEALRSLRAIPLELRIVEYGL